jgi:hypothetical protein
MGDPNPPLAAAPPNNFTVGSTVVPSGAAEVAFALREDQFRTLCEGEMSTDKSGRDLSIGLFVGAAVGFVGILATTDWATVWNSDRRTPLIWSSGILFFIAAGSLVGAIICCLRLYRTGKNSSYSRLKSRIEGFFKGNQSA